MNEKIAKARLELLSGMISETLDADHEGNDKMYEYSASYAEPANRKILGSWKVLKHTVNGRHYQDEFMENALRGAAAGDITYEATYEFSRNMCVKRVLICCLIDAEDGRATYEYRMNLVLEWEVRGKTLSVQPITGYQYTLIDGKPTSVRDLPPNPEWIRIRASVDGDKLLLEDGEDIKTLERIIP